MDYTPETFFEVAVALGTHRPQSIENGSACLPYLAVEIAREFDAVWDAWLDHECGWKSDFYGVVEAFTVHCVHTLVSEAPDLWRWVKAPPPAVLNRRPPEEFADAIRTVIKHRV